MESQNNLIWKGSLKVISSNPLLKVGPTSGQVGSTSEEGDSTASLDNFFPLLDHPYSEKPHISYISILVSVAASIEACSLRVVYPHYFSTLPSIGCISAPCFFSGTLHSFYPTQTQMQSQFWPVEGWHLIAGSGLRPVFY